MFDDMRLLSQAFLYYFLEYLLLVSFSVDEEDFIQFREFLHPLYESALVGMGRKTIDGMDFGFDDNLFTVDFDFFGAVHDFAPQSTFYLIADEDQRIFFIPETMLEVF